ncbi:MAG: AMP-binding protein [Desulfobacteraceae bacterium]|nr:AMP-binding protein [Desulfobacteraceae bacterium]
MKLTPLEGWIRADIREGGGELSREHIRAFQLEKLRETIDWSKARSPFYRERLAGAAAHDLTCPEDLWKLPFTTAEDLRREPHRFLCVSQSEVTRIVTLRTSGTAGIPKRVFFTAEDQERTIDFFHHGMATLAGPGDRVLVLLPAERPGSAGDLLIRGLKRLGALPVAYGHVLDAARTLDIIERERIDILVGVPVQILQLARLGGAGSAPGGVLLSTDYVPDGAVKEIARVWGCEVFTHYGMTEMGFGGGVECEARAGYHMRESDLFVEIVEPESGIPAEEGRPGEIVFTTLTRRAMPLIRYRTGDTSRFLPNRCPCGTVLKTLAKVGSRMDSVRLLANRAPLSMAELDEAVFPVAGVLDFSACLRKVQGLDSLQVDVRTMESRISSARAEIREALEAIPAVSSSLRNGTLALDISILREGRAVARNAKRIIVDERNRSILESPE